MKRFSALLATSLKGGLALSLFLTGSSAQAEPIREVRKMKQVLQFLGSRIQAEDPNLDSISRHLALVEMLELMGMKVPEPVRQNPTWSLDEMAQGMLRKPVQKSAAKSPSEAKGSPPAQTKAAEPKPARPNAAGPSKPARKPSPPRVPPSFQAAEKISESLVRKQAEVPFPLRPPRYQELDPQQLESLKDLMALLPLPASYRRRPEFEMPPIAAMARTLVERDDNPYHPLAKTAPIPAELAPLPDPPRPAAAPRPPTQKATPTPAQQASSAPVARAGDVEAAEAEARALSQRRAREILARGNQEAMTAPAASSEGFPADFAQRVLAKLRRPSPSVPSSATQRASTRSKARAFSILSKAKRSEGTSSASSPEKKPVAPATSPEEARVAPPASVPVAPPSLTRPDLAGARIPPLPEELPPVLPVFVAGPEAKIFLQTGSKQELLSDSSRRVAWGTRFFVESGSRAWLTFPDRGTLFRLEAESAGSLDPRGIFHIQGKITRASGKTSPFAEPLLLIPPQAQALVETPEGTRSLAPGSHPLAQAATVTALGTQELWILHPKAKGLFALPPGTRVEVQSQAVRAILGTVKNWDQDS